MGFNLSKVETFFAFGIKTNTVELTDFSILLFRKKIQTASQTSFPTVCQKD